MKRTKTPLAAALLLLLVWPHQHGAQKSPDLGNASSSSRTLAQGHPTSAAAAGPTQEHLPTHQQQLQQQRHYRRRRGDVFLGADLPWLAPPGRALRWEGLHNDIPQLLAVQLAQGSGSFLSVTNMYEGAKVRVRVWMLWCARRAGDGWRRRGQADRRHALMSRNSTKLLPSLLPEPPPTQTLTTATAICAHPSILILFLHGQDLALNYVASLLMLGGVASYVVAAFDPASLAACAAARLPCANLTARGFGLATVGAAGLGAGTGVCGCGCGWEG